MPVITGGKYITLTGKYVNAVSGAGENGYVILTPSVPSLMDAADSQFVTTTPIEIVLPGTQGGSPNSSGPGTFSQLILCTDNTELYPQGFTYTIEERVSNMGHRITKGVQIPSTLGSTVDLSVVLKPYI